MPLVIVAGIEIAPEVITTAEIVISAMCLDISAPKAKGPTMLAPPSSLLTRGEVVTNLSSVVNAVNGESGVAALLALVLLAKASKEEGAGKANTLEPGPYAGGSIPARGKARDFTKAERDKINEIGKTTGCHTCGSTNPGTKNGNFIPDHQPPSATVPDGTAQRLYPHCKSCSSSQGGTLSQMKRNGELP